MTIGHVESEVSEPRNSSFESISSALYCQNIAEIAKGRTRLVIGPVEWVLNNQAIAIGSFVGAFVTIPFYQPVLERAIESIKPFLNIQP